MGVVVVVEGMDHHPLWVVRLHTAVVVEAAIAASREAAVAGGLLPPA